MSDTAQKVSLSDIMSVLSDPTVVPSLRAEREVVAARLAQIDRMLAILDPRAENAPARVVAQFDPANESDAIAARVLQCFRAGYYYPIRDIIKASNYNHDTVYQALNTLRTMRKVECTGSGRGATWYLL